MCDSKYSHQYGLVIVARKGSVDEQGCMPCSTENAVLKGKSGFCLKKSRNENSPNGTHVKEGHLSYNPGQISTDFEVGKVSIGLLTWKFIFGPLACHCAMTVGGRVCYTETGFSTSRSALMLTRPAPIVRKLNSPSSRPLHPISTSGTPRRILAPWGGLEHLGGPTTGPSQKAAVTGSGSLTQRLGTEPPLFPSSTDLEIKSGSKLKYSGDQTGSQSDYGGLARTL